MTDLLHRRDPDGAEGAKSRRRAQLVSAPSLARRAADLGLPDLLLLGRGEEKTGGRGKAALWANAYEALVAALYLDGGFEAAHRFVRADFARDVEASDEELEDPKSRLQELLQGQGRPVPRYARGGRGGAEPPAALPHRVPARRRHRHLGRGPLEEGRPAGGRPRGAAEAAGGQLLIRGLSQVGPKSRFKT